jgi:hypothetical protein
MNYLYGLPCSLWFVSAALGVPIAPPTTVRAHSMSARTDFVLENPMIFQPHSLIEKRKISDFSVFGAF